MNLPFSPNLIVLPPNGQVTGREDGEDPPCPCMQIALCNQHGSVLQVSIPIIYCTLWQNQFVHFSTIKVDEYWNFVPPWVVLVFLSTFYIYIYHSTLLHGGTLCLYFYLTSQSHPPFGIPSTPKRKNEFDKWLTIQSEESHTASSKIFGGRSGSLNISASLK